MNTVDLFSIFWINNNEYMKVSITNMTNNGSIQINFQYYFFAKTMYYVTYPNKFNLFNSFLANVIMPGKALIGTQTSVL